MFINKWLMTGRFFHIWHVSWGFCFGINSFHRFLQWVRCLTSSYLFLHFQKAFLKLKNFHFESFQSELVLWTNFHLLNTFIWSWTLNCTWQGISIMHYLQFWIRILNCSHSSFHSFLTLGLLFLFQCRL